MKKKNENDHDSIRFLNALYQNCEPEGFIDFRFILKPHKPMEQFLPMSGLRSVPTTIEKNNDRNVYFGVATRRDGDGSKDGIIQIPVLWIDFDVYKISDEEKTATTQRYKDFPLKASFVIDSGGGEYLLWMLKEPASKEDIPRVEDCLKRLASYFHGDMNATDASRILRIPESLNHKYPHTPQVAIKGFHPERQYSLDDFDSILPHAESSEREHWSYQEEMNERLQAIMECEFLKHCDEDRATLSEPEWYAMVSILARETGGPNLIHSLSRGYPRYQPGETDKKIVHALNDTGPATCERIKRELFDCGKDCGVASPAVFGFKAKQDESRKHSSASSHKDQPAWPSPLAKEAFHGLAGEFVNLVEPHTESDPVAILVQFLSAVGNIVGPDAHFKVEADKHYLKIYPVLVGKTSKGRKGTSTGYVRTVFKQLDPRWRVTSGLSSGEGLIWQVRDEIKKSEPIREKGRVTGEYQEFVVDPGEKDKRLFVIEEEFASTLRLIGRDGNILSPIIRRAWDDGNLESLTKNSPARATGAHISIVGHVTGDELRRYLDRTEIANGFANRFIWICSERSKTLPDGGRFYDLNLEPILRKLREAIEFGKTVGELERSREAKKIWCEVYPALSTGKPGLLGAVISRAEAQVMRLACLYDILDKSKMIQEEHLLAGLALRDYSEASARYIFGDATGDWIADKILQALRRSPSGLSRTEISNLFSRNVSGEKIDSALSFLERLNRISMAKEDSGGRPVEKWVAV